MSDEEGTWTAEVEGGHVLGSAPEDEPCTFVREPASDRSDDLPPGTIRVEGGTKSPPLTPGRELTGAPDPELARIVKEGQARYHLDTLRQLEGESRLVEEEPPPPTPSPVRKLPALVSLAAVALVAGISLAPGAPPRERRLPPPRERPPGAPPRGCRSAGCRTLSACLCDCRKCRAHCRGDSRP